MMDTNNYIIIKTGFENISHEIEFQPQTIPKGKALVDAQHVLNVQKHRENGYSFKIEAQIIRQTSVTSTPYSTKLNIDSNRRVSDATCTCVYNQSKKCKHIAALIHYINSEQSLSKTDFEQQWGKLTARQFVNQKYSKGQYFYEMYKPKVEIEVNTKLDLNISQLKQPSALRTVLLETRKDDNDRAAKGVMLDIVNTVVFEIQIEEWASYLNVFLNLSEKKLIYTQNYTISEELDNFYKDTIVLSRKEIIELCSDTLEQSQCDKWYQSRSVQISGSKNVLEIKSRIRKPVEKLVLDMLYPKKIDTAALRYGRKNESIAAKEYERLYSTTIKIVGLFVSEKQPWLCVSLDGISVNNNSVNKIVEIKCPINCEKIPIVDTKCNVSYLKFDGTNVVLKESSVYYTQCQTQLYLTGLNICDLFIYSPVKNGSICISVHRNETFLQKVIHKCEEFYFKDYLPQLYARYCKANKGKLRCFTGENIVNKM